MTVPTDRRDALRRWVSTQTRCSSATPLEDTTPLLESRYLTSLQVPELLLYIESLRGRAIDLERLAPGDLRDIDTIARRFLDDES